MRRIAIGFVVWAIVFAWVVVGVFSQEVDPSGFTQQLNTARASRGLPNVSHDPAMVPTSVTNNEQQRQRGLGHFVLGGFAQCAAVGFSSAQSVLEAWTRSPGHAAIIYSPNASRIGFAIDGWAATVSVAMGPRIVESTVSTPVRPTLGTTGETCAGGCSTTPPPPQKSLTRQWRGRRCGFNLRLPRIFCR